MGNLRPESLSVPYNKENVARIRLLFIFSFITLLSAVPSVTFAAGYFGPVLPQSGSCFCNGGPLDWGCVFQVLQNLIQLAVSLGVIMCVMWIAYAGFSLMVSGGNPEKISEGKTRVTNAVIGIAIILCAWISVDFVMKAIYDPSTTFDGQNIGPWNAILASNGSDYCIRQTTPRALTNGQIIHDGVAGASSSGGTGAPVGTSQTGSGTCAILPSGACSTAVLQSTCFGSRVQDAARICNLESGGGNPSIQSGSDKLNSGSGPSYSIGLWQLNLTTTPGLSVGGRACTTAFSGPCSGSAVRISGHPGWCTQTVRDQNLYQQCVALAQNPQVNTERACYLYGAAHQGFGAWSYSANRCGVSH